MALNNKISNRDQKPVQTTEYLSNGETVVLSPGLIKRYLVSGGGAVTDEEVMMFLSLCKFQHLNPFLREAYLIKYGNQDATMVVGKDVFQKRAKRHKEYAGMQAGVIVYNAQTSEIIEREGTFYLKDEEELVGGWAKVYVRGYDHPVYESVSLEEYIGRTKDGNVNKQWATKPATMIRKVAVSHALKSAFPEDTTGLYIQEEIPEATAIALDEMAIESLKEPEKIEEKPQPAKPEVVEQDIAGALFGEE